MLLIIPYAIIAIIRSFTFRYRFDAGELVITSGLIFRNERHVPYGRIQNIDAVQNLLHRLLRVVEVRVETGGGDEPEAKHARRCRSRRSTEMRERVFVGRAAHRRQLSATAAGCAVAAAERRRSLLTLGPRELLLAGFIDSRGLIIVGAAFGLLWEVGLFDPTIDIRVRRERVGPRRHPAVRRARSAAAACRRSAGSPSSRSRLPPSSS